VPGLEDARAPLRLMRLMGGTVNEVFRVDTALGRFVLRLDGPQWRRPGVERARELALHTCAARAGLAPPIVYAAPQAHGLLVLEYLDGELWSAERCAQKASLRHLGERLATLHQLAPPPLAPFDPLEVARAYAASAVPTRSTDTKARDVLLRRLANVCSQLAASRRAPSIVHGDLAHGNLLQGRQLWLLDWEYAQVADPLMDAACLLAYYPNARAHATQLLAAAGLAASDVAEELELRTYVYEALAWLWHCARGETAPLP